MEGGAFGSEDNHPTHSGCTVVRSGTGGAGGGERGQKLSRECVLLGEASGHTEVLGVPSDPRPQLGEPQLGPKHPSALTDVGGAQLVTFSESALRLPADLPSCPFCRPPVPSFGCSKWHWTQLWTGGE